MNKDLAAFLLGNVLERARMSSDAVFLTKHEIQALASILDESSPLMPGSSGQSAKPTAPEAEQQRFISNAPPVAELATVVVASGEIPADTMLCVDFGTSFSKAFVSVGDEDRTAELIDISLGSGSGTGRLTTPSEMLIDGGYLYFGVHARQRLDDRELPSDNLIDSIKQFITLNKDVSKLSEQMMPEFQASASLGLSKRDILALYLAHLMALTEHSVQEKGLSRNIRRRFTHPAWSGDAKHGNEEEMRKLMAEAVLLARSAETDFRTRISVQAAKSLLSQLAGRNRETLPDVLIGDPVREATAAGAGALMAAPEGRRQPYLVLDIGAGTTDVAGFYATHNKTTGKIRLFEVSPAANALNLAGNVLDNALQKYALDLSGLAEGSQEYSSAALAIRRQKRLFKEELFRNGSVSIPLPTDQTVQISLPEFLTYKPVAGFTHSITEMVAKSAAAIIGDARHVVLVATGGGAQLPFIGGLGETGVTHDGNHIKLQVEDAIPDDVRDAYPDLVEPYPQIAVALGGSLSNLPEQMRDLSSAVSGGREGPVYSGPNYR